MTVSKVLSGHYRHPAHTEALAAIDRSFILFLIHTHHAHVSCCSQVSHMHCTNTYFTKTSIKRHQRKTTGCLPVTNKNEPIDTCTFIHQVFFSGDKLDRILCLHTLCNIYDNLFFHVTHPACHLLSRGHFTPKTVTKFVQS